MTPVLRNVIAVVLGLLFGGMVNMGIIIFGPILIPHPEGVDISTPEGLNAAMSVFEFKHFLVPFFAHALGTLLGAFLTAKISATRKIQLALLIGLFFLLGGIIMVVSLPNSPFTFNAVDLVFAYLPMAWIGAKLAGIK